MCETDYPHSDSTWPDCIDVVQATLIKDLPPRRQYKLLRGNAERLYRFTPAEPPVLACLTPTDRVVDRESAWERHVRRVRAGHVRPGRRGQGGRDRPAG